MWLQLCKALHFTVVSMGVRFRSSRASSVVLGRACERSPIDC